MRLHKSIIGPWAVALSLCSLCAYHAVGDDKTGQACSSPEEKFICGDDELHGETLKLKRLLATDTATFSSLPTFEDFQEHRRQTCKWDDAVAPSEETRRCYLFETHRRMDAQYRAHRLKTETYPETITASISMFVKQHRIPSTGGTNTPLLRVQQTELSALRPNGIDSPIHPPLSNFRCLEYVDVFEGDDLTPTHSLSLPTKHSWNCSLGTPVHEHEMKDPRIVAMTDFTFISLTDYNFDSYPDVEVVDMAASGPTQTRSHVFIYDPSTKRFALNPSLEDISAPIIDTEHKRIRSDRTYGGGALGKILSYRYDAGTFVLAEEETRERLSDHCLKTLGCKKNDVRPACARLLRCAQRTASCPPKYVKEIQTFGNNSTPETIRYTYERTREGLETSKSDSVICPTE
jgi:hypothetical protein